MAPKTEQRNEKPGLSVVLAEDEAIAAIAMRMELEALGYRVLRVASRGADALAHIRDIQPDLIVLDVRLADTVSGLDVAAAVRKFTTAPIVFVTGYDLQLVPQIKDIEHSIILQKPVNARAVHEAALPLLKN